MQSIGDIEEAQYRAKVLVQQIVESGEFELPLLPEVASRLLGMCNQPDCPPREMAACIRSDQAIATHVLRLANSSAFSSGTEIVSIQQAIARLGVQQLRQLVLVISCKTRVFDVKGFDNEVRESFRRSLGTALLNQEIARMRRLNVEDAFLCGLLHDIGRPVLFQALSDKQKQDNTDFDRQAALDAIDGNRIAIGARVIEMWTLPQRVADVVNNQLPTDAIESCQESQALCLAIKMTDSLFNEDGFDVEGICEHETVQPLNLYPEQITSILGKRESILDLIGCA